MSKHSTSGSPASPASSSAPPTPPAGPERTVSAACAEARAMSVRPPEDCMTYGSWKLQRARVGGEPVEVGVQQRRQRRVERGRGGALELAKRADEVAGQRKLRVGQQLGDQPAEHALVLRVGVGVQQRHGDRFGLGVGDALHERARGVGVELAQRAVRSHALGRGEAQLGGDERHGRRVAQAVEMRARLARELDHVGEAVGGDERRARGAPLQQRVGGDGHAVREALHVGGLRAGARQHEAHGVEHGARLIAGRGGDLGGVHGASRRRRARRR